MKSPRYRVIKFVEADEMHPETAERRNGIGYWRPTQWIRSFRIDKQFFNREVEYVPGTTEEIADKAFAQWALDYARYKFPGESFMLERVDYPKPVHVP